MRPLSKVLGIACAGGAGIAGAALVWRTMRARATAEGWEQSTGDAQRVPVPDEPVPNMASARANQAPTPSAGGAGAMSVGAVDEVALAAGIARTMRPDVEPDMFDPEEVPSEHSEINELRNKMPFG